MMATETLLACPDCGPRYVSEDGYCTRCGTRAVEYSLATSAPAAPPRQPLLIVGEDNPYSDEPEHALMHLPRGASGDRLREHLGLRDTTYAALEKCNLCVGRWRKQEAYERAFDLTATRTGVIVTLGGRVRKAFDVEASWAVRMWRDLTIVALPHPSGRNLIWNDPAARPRARQLLRELAPWVPWGEVDA